MAREIATRPYRMQRRAESQQETRRRITEAAVELHGTLGPSKTSMSAVAEKAGVRRSTLYRHFPDEAALFDACSLHWARANPLPDLTAWARIADPDVRLSVALDELYGFYRRTDRMLENLIRDEDLSPIVKERFAAIHAYLAAAQATLARGRGARGAKRRRVNAAIGHAIAFGTWKSLARDHGLTDADAARLMREMVAASA